MAARRTSTAPRLTGYNVESSALPSTAPRSARVRSRSGAPPAGVRLVPATDPAGGVGETAAAAGADGDDTDSDAGEWGRAGRLGIYVCNLGELCSGPWTSAAAAALVRCKAQVLAVQECTDAAADHLRNAGWLLSDAAYIGAGRKVRAPCLLVAARPSDVREVETMTRHSGHFGTDSELSYHIFARLKFRWGVSGMKDLALGNFHLHRDTAKRGPNSDMVKQWAARLSHAIDASQARVLVGDANMGLYMLRDLFGRCGVELTLVASHREIAVTRPVMLMTPEGRCASLNYDSLGVWAVGPLRGASVLTLDSKCLLGALHPALLEEHRGRYKTIVRGFPLVSYKHSEGARETPTEECAAAVLRLWDAHEATASSRLPAARVWTLDYGRVQDRAMADIWDGAKPWVFQCGEARKDLFRTMGVSFAREALKPAARASGATMTVTDTWQALPTVKEVPVCFEEWDLEGFFWGRPGHFPLWVVIGDVSTRSAAGVLQKQVKDAKKQLWRTSLRQQNWPWWIWHESERSYWLPGDFSSGRGWSGYWWRHAAADIGTIEAERQNARWAALYGEEAYRESLRCTEWVMELPYPPETCETTLSYQAAYGEPRVWPAFQARPPAHAVARSLWQHASSAALPDVSARASSSSGCVPPALAGPLMGPARSAPVRPPPVAAPPPPVVRSLADLPVPPAPACVGLRRSASPASCGPSCKYKPKPRPTAARCSDLRCCQYVLGGSVSLLRRLWQEFRNTYSSHYTYAVPCMQYINYLQCRYEASRRGTLGVVAGRVLMPPTSHPPQPPPRRRRKPLRRSE